jgi:hypothetical protein
MSRPVGRVTRGTTGSNRLRRVDRWITHLAGREIRSADSPLSVDLGFGSAPTTTAQWQHTLRGINPASRVVGIEIDRERVAAAAGIITAIHGGFEIPTDRRPLLIRAANVLRQYPLDEVASAWHLMSSRLAAGGWLIDGTCDEQGRLAAMLSIDATGQPVWFTVSVRLAGLQAPSQVAARLPKALIHDNVAGSGIHGLLEAMDRNWAAAPRWGARQRWIHMASNMRAQGWAVRDSPNRWRLGELTVTWEQVAPA